MTETDGTSDMPPYEPTATATGVFATLGLSATMLAALEKAGYTEPTPVQAGTIPVAMAGVDVMAQARTGTGKTAAFVIPILERLAKQKRGEEPQALVLVPTRELAVQVRDEFTKLAHGRKTRIVALYGGKPLRGQIDKLKKGADCVVGTPGRVLDHIGRGTLILNSLRMAVLDEADRMLDIGFRPDIEKILRRCPKERQTLLLSATVPPPVARLAQRYMTEPENLNFSPAEITVDTIDQYYFTVESNRKFDLLVKLLEREKPQQAIIFCRTRRETDRVSRMLTKRVNEVDCIHGDLNQNGRDRVMEGFRAGRVKILVATDVVGRGIDVSNISHIINYQIPQFSDDYVHRVGRTGRMGRSGVAYTFVSPEEGNELTRIEVRINQLLKRDEIEGFHTVAVASPPPTKGSDNRSGEPDVPAPAEEAPPAGNPPGRRPKKKYRRAL